MQRTQPLTSLVTPAVHESTWEIARQGRPKRFGLPGIRPLPFLFRLMAVLTVAAVLLPVAYLIIRALGAGEAGVKYLLDERTLKVVWNSLALTGAVVLSSALIGVPFAWLTARTDLPFRRAWLVLGLLTLVIPSYIGALTYIAAFGPRGILQQALEPLGVTELPTIYGFFGAWLAVTLFTYPYVVMPVRAALLNMDPALEETARGLGLGQWTVFRRVILPQLRPALAVGALLAALYTLSDFGAVALMQYDAFTRVIYLQYTSSFDRNLAAVLSLVLIVVTAGLLLLERRWAAPARNGRNYRAGVGAQRCIRPVELGRWRIPALLFCATLVGIGLLTPVGVLLSWLVQAATASYQRFSPEFVLPTLNAVGASGLAALVVGAVAVPLAWLAVRSPSRVSRWLVQLAYLGNGLPGIVIALALVFFAANALPGLYQTLPILVLGYAVRFLPLSIGATRSALSQVNPRLEEAGRSLGLRAWSVGLRITFPLVRTGALGGMALVFLSAMKELPTTLLLSPTGFKTLATQIWTARTAARFTEAAAPALLLIAVSAASLFLILRGERANHSR